MLEATPTRPDSSNNDLAYRRDLIFSRYVVGLFSQKTWGRSFLQASGIVLIAFGINSAISIFLYEREDKHLCEVDNIRAAFQGSGKSLSDSINRLIEACQPTSDNPPGYVGECFNGNRVIADIEMRNQGRRIGAIPVTDLELRC